MKPYEDKSQTTVYSREALIYSLGDRRRSCHIHEPPPSGSKQMSCWSRKIHRMGHPFSEWTFSVFFAVNGWWSLSTRLLAGETSDRSHRFCLRCHLRPCSRLQLNRHMSTTDMTKTREEDAWEATGDEKEEEMEFASQQKYRPKSTCQSLNPPLLGEGIARSMQARRIPHRCLRVHRRRRSCHVSAR